MCVCVCVCVCVTASETRDHSMRETECNDCVRECVSECVCVTESTCLLYTCFAD